MKQHYNLIEKVKSIRDEASKHKKAVKYHRRRLNECMGLVEMYEKKLAEYGIKLEIQSQGGNNGKEKSST